MQSIGVSRFGLKKKVNQDALCMDRELMLFMLADGVSSNPKGEVASHILLQRIQEQFKTFRMSSREPKEQWTRAIQEGSLETFQHAVERPECYQMATTFVGCFLQGDSTLYFAHAGDSSLYLLRRGFLYSLVEPHNLLQDTMRFSEQKPDQLEKRTSHLTRYFGYQEQEDFEQGVLSLEKADRLFLCTDGVSSALDEQEIVQLLQRTGPLQTEYINRAVEKKGAKDNYSYIILH